MASSKSAISFSTKRRSGVHSKVVSDILGHKRVNLAIDVHVRNRTFNFTD